MVIDQISQMKQQGVPTNQIIQNLRQQGVSPKEINEALSQSEIKSEISNPNQNVFPDSPQNSYPRPQEMQSPNQGNSQGQHSLGQNQIQSQQNQGVSAQMQPSISSGQNAMGIQPFQESSQQSFQENAFTQPQTMEAPMQDFSSYQDVNPYSDSGYDSYPEYQGSGGADIETINDIASQLIDEKTKHFKKDFSESINFKKESKNKIEEINKRLTKIEEIIEELQRAIIRKVGEYGQDIKSLAEEMKATQDSFSKVINPLTEKAKEVKESQPKKPEKRSDQKKQNSDSFENYLR